MNKTLYATFTAKPGAEAAVSRLIRQLAEQVRTEPGNLVFEVSTFADEPRKFFVYEVYADEEAFEAHISAPYGAVFNAALNALIEEPSSQLTFLDSVSR